MPWAKIGDTAAHHPIVLRAAEHPDADHRTVNEVFGFVVRATVLSAAHLTDYIISRGTALALAGSEADRLLRIAVFAGYLTPVTHDGLPAFKLVEDPDFLHLRTREEIEWERQRKADRSNPEIAIPARLRDGDACRYCGMVVNFLSRNGRLQGTLDHLTPGRRAQSHDDVVVACKRCNSSLGDMPRSERLTHLLPVAPRPYFHRKTIEWLRDHEWVRTNHVRVPEPPARNVKTGAPAPGRPSVTPQFWADGHTPTDDEAPRTQHGQPAPDGDRSDGGPRDTADTQPVPDPAPSPAHPEQTPGTQPAGPPEWATEHDSLSSHPGTDSVASGSGTDEGPSLSSHPHEAEVASGSGGEPLTVGPTGPAAPLSSHPKPSAVASGSGDGPEPALSSHPNRTPVASGSGESPPNRPEDPREHWASGRSPDLATSAHLEVYTGRPRRDGTGRDGSTGREGQARDGAAAPPVPPCPPAPVSDPSRSRTRRKRRSR